MKYPKALHKYEEKINRFAQLKAELGSKKIYKIIDERTEYLDSKIEIIEQLSDGERFNEPSTYKEILEQSNVNNLETKSIDDKQYFSKLQGAIIGRFAGCALGAPVELLSIGELEYFAKEVDHSFPPVDYWPKAPNGFFPRYKNGAGNHFTKEGMTFLSTDDDIAYTLLSLLLIEKHGKAFTKNNLAELWKAYLPVECTFTAERTTIDNLLNGLPVDEAGVKGNYDTEFIGASIRCDGYGYINPGNPLEASKLAFIDASLSHQRSGIYSSMYFAAVISMAFTSSDIIDTMYEALNVIPKDSLFHTEIMWALDNRDVVSNYKIANQMVTEKFKGMSWVHAINNACLTVWGICIGKNNFEKGISETVAMAYDNDCTAATVGSVLGSYLGIDAIGTHWYKPWNNTIRSYLKGIETFDLDDIIKRYYCLRSI